MTALPVVKAAKGAGTPQPAAPAPLARPCPDQPLPARHACCHPCHPALRSAHGCWSGVAGMGGSCPGLGRGCPVPRLAARTPAPHRSAAVGPPSHHQAAITAATPATLHRPRSRMAGWAGKDWQHGARAGEGVACAPPRRSHPRPRPARRPSAHPAITKPAPLLPLLPPCTALRA